MKNFNLIPGALALVLLINYSSSKKLKGLVLPHFTGPVHTVQKDPTFDGLYEGLEYMGIITDPAYPGIKFKAFHVGRLKIRGDSAFLDQNPIFVHKTDTSFSASDGGFYYYSGTFQKIDHTILFSLKEMHCDYCRVPIKTNINGDREISQRTKTLKGAVTGKGLLINGFLYVKTAKTEILRSEQRFFTDK